MTILLPALAVDFAAFCVWLTVRIVNRRERWAKRTAMGLIALSVLYAPSSGPMRTVAFRHRMIATKYTFARPQLGPDRVLRMAVSERVVPIVVMDKGAWWPTAYGPLVWPSEQAWGAPVNWYWKRFPIRVVTSQ